MSKLIYVNTNCQGGAIKALFREVLPDWQVEGLPVHERAAPADLDRASDLMATADVVISQPISDKYHTVQFRSANVAALSRNAVISFPSIYFTGQHITLCALKTANVRLATPGLTYHDSIVAGLVARGASDEAILARMTDRDLFDRHQVLSESDAILAQCRQFEVEDGCHVTVSDYFRDHIGDRILCHSFNHPVRSVMVHVCNQILNLLGEPARIAEEGEDSLRFPHHPLLPSVAWHLGQVYHTEDFRFHYATKSLSFAEYIALVTKTFRREDPIRLAALRETELARRMADMAGLGPLPS